MPFWQKAVAPEGAVQLWQLVPHVVTESATHMLPQKFGVVVEAQRSPHAMPSQVTVVPLPAGPSGQIWQRVPQVLIEKLETHWPLQSWYPTLH